MESLLQENKESLAILANISSALSFIGCLFIVWTYFAIRGLRKTPAFKMIVHLAVADFGLTANGLINVQASSVNPEFCGVWAYFRQHLALTTILWPLAFSHTMYCFFTGRYKTQHDLSNVLKYYIMFCWGGPFIVSIIPVFFDAYGSGGIYCWLNASYHDTDTLFGLSLAIFYGPIVVVTGLMLFFYSQILRHLIRNPTPESKSVVYNLFFYPLGFIVTYAFAASDRFINLEFQGHVVWLFKAHIVLQQLQGLINALIYGSSSKVRNQLKLKFHRNKKEEPKEETQEYFQIPDDYIQQNQKRRESGMSDERQESHSSPYASLMTSSSSLLM